MNIPLTAEVHKEGDWYVAFCPEVPEANGQGSTQEECLESLRQAVLLLMEDRREDAQSKRKTQSVLLERVKNAGGTSKSLTALGKAVHFQASTV